MTVTMPLWLAVTLGSWTLISAAVLVSNMRAMRTLVQVSDQLRALTEDIVERAIRGSYSTHNYDNPPEVRH